MAREMKDSGIAWIGFIPDDWYIQRNKFCFECSKEIVGEKSTDTQLLSLTTKGIKEKRPEDSTGKVPDTYDTYQVVVPNDIVMCLFDLDVSAVFSGISPYYGMISPAYKVLKCKKERVIPAYVDYWFSYIFDGRKFRHYAKNLRYTLNYDEFADLPIVLPDTVEQQRIADFLDKECARIDSVIEQTRQSIEEYKKLKQSIITEAVTKGIRPNRPMKDSGIEWIGEIPEEWMVSRVGLHYIIILGKMLCSVPPSGDYSLERYFCAANVHFDSVSDVDTLKKMWFSPQEKQLYQVRNGDLLVVEGGAGAGGSAVVTGLTETAFIQNSIMIVREKKNDDNRYLRYLLEYLVKQGYIEVACNKATIPHFTKDKLATVPYPVVATDERVQIADYLDCKCNEIDNLIANKEKIITELETYKKSLIYEYATGKKEV